MALRTLLRAIFSPWRADPPEGRMWAALCALCVLPFAAVLHHLVFFRPTCMLNPFGPDYTPQVVIAWLRADPSLAWAVVLAGALHLTGRQMPGLRIAVAPLFATSLPVTLWLWDVPGTGRALCHAMHDGRIGLRTTHIYLVCLSGYLVALALAVGARARRAAKVGGPVG